MILSWTHNQENGILTCTINENLKYETPNGGGTFIKTYNGETTEILTDGAWEDEKIWLSENFSDTLGVYSPQWEITEESWAEEHPDYDGALPLFGLSPSGEYLDKLQRTASVQEGKDMLHLYQNLEERIMIEQDSAGNYWRRPWCDERAEFYNVQPCCVFPFNPGRQPMDTAEAEKILSEWHGST